MLLHSSHESDVLFSNRVADALVTKGFCVKDACMHASAPSMRQMQFWEYQNYKSALENYIAKKIEPVIKSYAGKGMLVVVLSQHFFAADESWEQITMGKLRIICESHKCRFVPVRNDLSVSDGQMDTIIKDIYAKSIE